MKSRRVLQSLQRLAVLERDDARGRKKAAAEQLSVIQERVQGALKKINDAEDSVRESFQPGLQIDPHNTLASNAYLMREWTSLVDMRREERLGEALVERAQRDLSYRQARVKALVRHEERAQESRRFDTWKSSQRDSDRMAAELGGHLKAGIEPGAHGSGLWKSTQSD